MNHTLATLARGKVMGRLQVLLIFFSVLQFCHCQKLGAADETESNPSVSGKTILTALDQSTAAAPTKIWRLKFLEFPHSGKVCLEVVDVIFYLPIASASCDHVVALYDSGLSNSLKVSVRVSQNNSNATITFMVRDKMAIYIEPCPCLFHDLFYSILLRFRAQT